MTTNIQTLKVAVHLCVKVRTAGAICPMLDSLSSRMMHKAVLVLETVCTLILKTKLPPMSWRRKTYKSKTQNLPCGEPEISFPNYGSSSRLIGIREIASSSLALWSHLLASLKHRHPPSERQSLQRVSLPSTKLRHRTSSS